MKILIVDDKENTCEEIKSELEYLVSNQVLTSRTISNAKQIVDSESLCCAILDLKLDNTSAYSGMKIYAYIKKNKPSIKTIIMSAFAFSDIKEELIKELLRENLPASEINVIEQYYVDKSGIEDYIDVILRNLELNSRWYGKYHALLIAVQEYENPTTPNLRYPKKDIERLENILKDRYEFDSVCSLINPKRQEIICTLYNLAEELNIEDNLLIFYAGHGHRDEKVKVVSAKKNEDHNEPKGIGYWIPSNAILNEALDDPSEWLSHSDIRDLISRIGTKHTLLISDACFSGTFLELRERGVKLVKTNDEEYAKKIYNHSSRRVLTSGGPRKKVYDISVFLNHFIKCLKSNKEKYLPASVIHDLISESVNTESKNQQMYGKLPGTGDEEDGDFIFIRK